MTTHTMVITLAQALIAAQAAGFAGERLVTMVAIALAESGLNALARNTNRDGSLDRGIVQINNKYHPEVTDVCADDPACAFRAAFAISDGGSDFTPWSTYVNGAYKQYLAAVRIAAPAPPNYPADVRVQSIRRALDAGAPTAAENHGLDSSLVLPHFVHPFDGSYTVSQTFGNQSYQGEPPGILFPDGSVGYVMAQGGVWVAHTHNGVDYPEPCGTPLHPMGAQGVVTYARHDDTGFGLCLQISYGRYRSLYGHLSKILVAEGQHVSLEQLVAYSGGSASDPIDSGNSTGCHCHISVIDNTTGHFLPLEPFFTAPAPVKPVIVDGWYTPVAPPITLHAMTDGFPVHTFWGASQQSGKYGEVAPGSALTILGWAYGQAVWDKTAKALDRRWYQVDAGHTARPWIASARINGNVPGTKP